MSIILPTIDENDGGPMPTDLTEASLHKQARGLGQLQELLERDPRNISKIIQVLESFHPKDDKLRERKYLLYRNCMNQWYEHGVTVNPELCALAMEGIAAMNNPQDEAFLQQIEYDILARQPRLYSAHYQALVRKDRSDLALEKNRVASNLEEDEVYGRDLIRMAVIKELSGDIQGALASMRELLGAMPKGANETRISISIHLRRLYLQEILLPHVVFDPEALEKSCSKIEDIEKSIQDISSTLSKEKQEELQLVRAHYDPSN